MKWWSQAVWIAATAGCVVRAEAPWLEYTSPEPIEVEQPPPPTRVEVQSPAPMSDGVWIAGHWEWRGGRYLWIDGRWERVRTGYVWIEPQYARQGVGWVYVRGHWRPARGQLGGSAAPPVRRAIPAPPARSAVPRS